MRNNFKSILAVAYLGLIFSSCGNPISSGNTSEGQSTTQESVIEFDPSVLDEFNDELRDVYENDIKKSSFIPNVENIQACDPFVLRFNGMYYLYFTTGGDHCACYESEDLLHWQKVHAPGLEPGYCYEGQGAVTPWAPEVRYYNGLFYMVTSPSGQGHKLLVSENPYGPFVNVNDKFFTHIDGSIFIDSDEKPYMTVAGTNGITIKRLAQDFSSVKTDKIDVNFVGSKLGRWNEGPYITKRFGKYYLTWTAVDCYAPSYRVEYNYYDGGDSLFKAGAFKQKGGYVLFDTSDEFNGLGHSANVLGPDLDSYYITYHDLHLTYDFNARVTSNRRYYNFSRLSFNGSTMVSDNPTLNDNFVVNRPEFETFDSNSFSKNGNYLLSDFSSGDHFTAEFNYEGNNASFIFSYVDEKNYCFAEYGDKSIILKKVSNGNESEITTISLVNEYDFSYLHTLRLNYGDNKLHVYFDDIEKLANFDITLSGGKIGYYRANYNGIYYTACSNVGNGSSDYKEYQKVQSLANQYDREKSLLGKGSALCEITDSNEELNYKDSYNLKLANKGDVAVYRTYFDDTSKSICVRFPKEMAGKKIGVRVNNSDVKEITINITPGENEFIYNLGNFNTKVGRNYVCIENVGDEVLFSRIDYHHAISSSQISEYSLESMYDNFVFKDVGMHQFEETGTGIGTLSDDNCFVWDSNNLNMADGSIECDVYLKEEFYDKFANRRASLGGSLTGDIDELSLRYGSGIILGARNHEYYADGVNYECAINNVQGLYLYVNNEMAVLKEVDYYHTKVIKKEKLNLGLNNKITLKLERNNNNVKAYINGNLFVEYVTSTFVQPGKVGLYSFFNECEYRNLTINNGGK